MPFRGHLAGDSEGKVGEKRPDEGVCECSEVELGGGVLGATPVDQ